MGTEQIKWVDRVWWAGRQGCSYKRATWEDLCADGAALYLDWIKVTILLGMCIDRCARFLHLGKLCKGYKRYVICYTGCESTIISRSTVSLK